jgi:AcrR family transcriptional regulator
MGTKERREREKQELRDAILVSAREIAAAEGWSAVSIRKIADRIEYSPPMIYEYFENKEQLLLALLVEGYRQLLARMQHARQDAPNAEAALLTMSVDYWAFARDNPELYRVMNGLDGVSFTFSQLAEKPPEIVAVIGEVLTAITAWSREAQVTLENPLDAFFAIWGTLHGLVSLDLAGLIKDEASHPRDLITHSIRTLLAGLRGASH